MNPMQPPSPHESVGPRYWRSLDELAETPAFKDWLEREFPQNATELVDPVSRRSFVKLMSASLFLAGLGLTGCRRPEEVIHPFSRMPENYVHGVAQHFATAMPTRGSAIPLLVRSNDGRPTKIEGNPSHPASNGGTDTFAQASILGLYDPDRSRRCRGEGKEVTQEAAFDFLTALSKQHAATGGAGLCILMEPSSSPSRARLQAALLKKLPQTRFVVYEPVDHDIHRRAASLAAGKSVKPYFKLDQPKVILSLDCDFLGTEEDSSRSARDFARQRKVEKPGDSMNRLYLVEPLMTLTGMNADHRMRVPSIRVLSVLAAIGAQISPEFAKLVEAFPLPAGVSPDWIKVCAKDLQDHPKESLLLAGHRQPLAVHLMVNALNALLENVGRTVVFNEVPAGNEGSLVDLGAWLDGGQVETLVILGGNPAYDAPGDLNWADKLKKAKKIIRLGYQEDETSVLAHWHLPATHFLESWGDARTSDGTYGVVQPLIQPLFEGLTELEVLARLGGLEPFKPYAIVRETFKTVAGSEGWEDRWKKCLHNGFLAGSAATPTQTTITVASVLNQAKALADQDQAGQAPLGPKNLEVIFHRDYSVDDGRYANNGWLQEFPDPVTKLTWDNTVLMSRRTAEELGLKNEEVVEIEWQGRKAQGPVWIQPGQADYTLGLALGYGRERAGRIGNFDGGKVGFNVNGLRGTATGRAGAGGADSRLVNAAVPVGFGVGAKITPTGRKYSLSCPQDHWSMEGRPIIREASLKHFTEEPDFARKMDMEHPPMEEDAHGHPKPLYPNPIDKMAAKAYHQWGMSIDLSSCTGCGACVIACQSENNTPIVGKDQVRRGREMHWLRIDRYYSGDPAKEKQTHNDLAPDQLQAYEAWIDEAQVAVQPMMCQHCEAAPCESVCPVNATVHDEEGLNVMAYNRCVGTRYCSNNCPYKVRRFNFFDYNKRPIEKLYQGPLATRSEEEWDLIKMVKNPDVSVRMRGVMEKCTFCVQRIEQAKISQKIKAGASNEVVVPEGTFKSACQQACPSEAIVFGNLSDPNSRVSKLKALSRDYSVLEFLNTKPRATYLARVRNPNPAMPDYSEKGAH